jgi:hypothetical protein
MEAGGRQMWQNATVMHRSTYAFNSSNRLKIQPLILARGKTLEKSGEVGEVANSALSQFLA